MPTDFPASLAGCGKYQPLLAWVARRIKQADDQPLPGGDEKTAIPLSTEVQGLAFLVHRNHDMIYPYNAAESYILAIALLSDRLHDSSGLVAS